VETRAPLLGEPWPVELMNTIWADRDGVHDELDDPADAAAWLALAAVALARDVSGPMEPDAAVHRRLRTLRDALRRLGAETTADPRTAWTSPTTADDALAALNDVAAAAPSWARLCRGPDGGFTRVSASAHPASEAVVSVIAEQGVDLFTDPGQGPLRACLGPGCVLYFVKAHPRREWCSAGCGNRARVARHYRRHRDD
jgi:predicted RNA-binding Zn ribbon-like protein